ncbi:carbohydrate ABC transporter substrate-binding protein, CUT1 family [Jatrophihabitans endophyticus]|uniref:Carbohydrate ABC transporter substrate-binding protein, CUT1 family n=1 Tax=Jatrophihabitans endophyticus TaxID=1206085 RepID=A0A1M5DKW8_9ACTN|nr:extracellular solute-binding protein [Jatrophihabitans endophyticus]SHF67668.1 carbohydrate ABC transporter substrate-binding protein, CUT1 family [Jatrophihabitans endophyticus]
MRRNLRKTIGAGVTAILAASVLSACGGGSGGTPTITWYFNPDSGGQTALAKQCQAQANGKYRIATQVLPSDASAQRQQLVSRLTAKDPSIGFMSLDPVFVAEFADAGFLADVPEQYRSTFTQDIVKPSVEASTWKGKLVAAPFWANTQLLWYRKDLVSKVPGLAAKLKNGTETWDDVIAAAKSQRRDIGVQASLYEGYTVWINALVAGAGGQILDNPGADAKQTKLGLDTTAGREAAAVISKLAAAKVGGPALSSTNEDAALKLFENPSSSMFMTIWPYVWGAMKTDGVKFRDQVGWTYYPRTVATKQSRPPFGGIELGVSKYAANQDAAWDAIRCIRTAENQAKYFLSSSNPPANETAYSNADVKKNYPMAALIRESLNRAAARPKSQYYGDLSTALQQSFSPPQSVNSSTPKDAETFILQVLKGEKLL